MHPAPVLRAANWKAYTSHLRTRIPPPLQELSAQSTPASFTSVLNSARGQSSSLPCDAALQCFALPKPALEPYTPSEGVAHVQRCAKCSLHFILHLQVVSAIPCWHSSCSQCTQEAVNLPFPESMIEGRAGRCQSFMAWVGGLLGTLNEDAL